MRVGIIGGSIAGCATAALLHRAGHDVTVFERSESDLVSRGAGIVTATAAWQDMVAHGLIDEAIYSFVPGSYARDRLCLVGDAGTVFPPFTGSGVLRAVANATSFDGRPRRRVGRG